jgi:hypothetical protein
MNIQPNILGSFTRVFLPIGDDANDQNPPKRGAFYNAYIGHQKTMLWKAETNYLLHSLFQGRT